MNSIEIVRETAVVVEKDFYFEDLKGDLPTNADEGFDYIFQQLANCIAYMLDHDFELLMQVFYRIDLSEVKVKQAIALADNPSEKLASLVLDREMQKAKTRLEYRNRIKSN